MKVILIIFLSSFILITDACAQRIRIGSFGAFNFPGITYTQIEKEYIISEYTYDVILIKKPNQLYRTVNAEAGFRLGIEYRRSSLYTGIAFSFRESKLEVEYLEGFNKWNKNVLSVLSVGGMIPIGISHRIINTQKLRVNLDAGLNYTYNFVQYDNSEYDIFRDILYTSNRHYFSTFAGFKFGFSFLGVFDFFIGPQIERRIGKIGDGSSTTYYFKLITVDFNLPSYTQLKKQDIYINEEY
ncbi:hypothetical protein ACFLRI_03865 [Bacteroidota bacterium]